MTSGEPARMSASPVPVHSYELSPLTSTDSHWLLAAGSTRANPTAAATAFAKKCGVGVDDLGREKTPKGEWLAFSSVEPGRAAAELLPELIETTLGSLPIPRRMAPATSPIFGYRSAAAVFLI